MKWEDARTILTEPLPVMRKDPDKLEEKEPSSTLIDVIKKVENFFPSIRNGSCSESIPDSFR